jgi:hypothetical protein
MIGAALRGFAIGWVVGHAVATVVVRRAKRRRLRIDRDDTIDKWSLAVAIVLAVTNACFRVV